MSVEKVIHDPGRKAASQVVLRGRPVEKPRFPLPGGKSRFLRRHHNGWFFSGAKRH